MEKILNVSDKTNAVLHALALVAVSQGNITAQAAAKRLGVSPTYLAKALQPLAKAGILASTRGPTGGFVLAREAATLSCLEVMELLDGKLADRHCLFETAVCATGTCQLGALCREVAGQVISVFRNTSIADLARSF